MPPPPGGIALINSLGSLGGFIAPSLRTAAERAFSSTSAGLVVLGASSLLAALLIGTLLRRDGAQPADSFHDLLHRAR